MPHCPSLSSRPKVLSRANMCALGFCLGLRPCSASTLMVHDVYTCVYILLLIYIYIPDVYIYIYHKTIYMYIYREYMIMHMFPVYISIFLMVYNIRYISDIYLMVYICIYMPSHGICVLFL